ncbi:MAG: molybdenum cofactor guanylyltransferase, partial [Spirochaetota bacterium]
MEYHSGRNQKDFCRELGARLGLPTFFSVNRRQRWDGPCVVDHWPECGPIGGIASLLQSSPKSAWLVIACDMPALSEETLDRLLCERQPQCKATIYCGESGPEPLCAIYEPNILSDLQEAITAGHYGLRKLLGGFPENGLHTLPVRQKNT